MCAISDLPFTVPHVFEYASCLHVHVEKPLFLNEICVIYQFLHGMIYRYLFTNYHHKTKNSTCSCVILLYINDFRCDWSVNKEWSLYFLSAGEATKWEKITYVGIIACTILTIVNLSKGHPHHEEPPVSVNMLSLLKFDAELWTKTETRISEGSSDFTSHIEVMRFGTPLN